MSSALKKAWQNFKRELKVYELAMKHPETPWLSRMLLGWAVAYALSPVDFIPDFIPLIGHLDDAVIIPLLVITAVKLIPAEIMEECRIKAGE